MNVLIACEESQTVCLAFRELGHEAFSCDVQASSGGYPKWHIQGDAIKEAYSGKYDLMIAHPPCTYLSNAGACRMFPKSGELNHARFELAMEAREFFIKLLNAPIKYKAIENPRSLRCVKLPPYTQTIQPYQHGHEFSKDTRLWLRNLPLLRPTKYIYNYTPYISNLSGIRSKKQRSKTFAGIAAAMALQWSHFIEKNEK